jgi:hypothetical protein
MAMNKRPTLMALPLELIDHILTFLLWPHDVHPLLLASKSLNPIAERILYRNIGELPARRAVRLLLSLANAPTTRCELIKTLSLDFIENRVLFALELLMAKVLKRLPRLRSLSVEVSVHENRHRALAWIFPRDAPFRLRSFATSIRYRNVIYHPLVRGSWMDIIGLTQTWPRSLSPSLKSATSRCGVYPHARQIPSRSFPPRSRTSKPSGQFMSIRTPLGRYVLVYLSVSHPILSRWD